MQSSIPPPPNVRTYVWLFNIFPVVKTLSFYLICFHCIPINGLCNDQFCLFSTTPVDIGTYTAVAWNPWEMTGRETIRIYCEHETVDHRRRSASIYHIWHSEIYVRRPCLYLARSIKHCCLAECDGGTLANGWQTTCQKQSFLPDDRCIARSRIRK